MYHLYQGAHYQTTVSDSTWNKNRIRPVQHQQYKNTQNLCHQYQMTEKKSDGHGNVDQYGIKRSLWQKYIMQYKQIPSQEVWAEVQRNILKKYVQRGHMGAWGGVGSALRKHNSQEMAGIKKISKYATETTNKYSRGQRRLK